MTKPKKSLNHTPNCQVSFCPSALLLICLIPVPLDAIALDIQLLHKAKEGDTKAQAALSGISSLAFKWFQKAAEHGRSEAMFCLGEMLLTGADGIKQNLKKAV